MVSGAAACYLAPHKIGFTHLGPAVVEDIMLVHQASVAHVYDSSERQHVIGQPWLEHAGFEAVLECRVIEGRSSKRSTILVRCLVSAVSQCGGCV